MLLYMVMFPWFHGQGKENVDDDGTEASQPLIGQKWTTTQETESWSLCQCLKDESGS